MARLDQHWFGMDKKARDEAYQKMKKKGMRVKRTSLPGQDTWEPGMASFGVPMSARKGYKRGTVYGIIEY